MPSRVGAGMSPARWLALVSTSAAIVLCVRTSVAVAQPPSDPDRARAEALFQEAREQMKRENFAGAAPLLESSIELNPALGARINLAACYERTGRPASAWHQYREVARGAAESGQAERARVAQDLAAALEPHLPRLVVRSASVGVVPGLAITRDGTPVDPMLLDTVLYVDPGEHEVHATAPGHVPFAIRVLVRADEQVVVVVPALQPEAVSAPAGDESAAPPEVREPVARDRVTHEPPAPDVLAVAGKPPSPGRRSDSRRALAWVSAGTGAVVLASSLGLGVAAKVAWDDAGRFCDLETLACESAEGPPKIDTARSRARAANLLAGTGAVLLATGAALYWFSRDTPGDVRSARIVPTMGPSGIGLTITGGF